MEAKHNPISINQEMKNNLLAIAQWARVLSIIAYVFLGAFFLLSAFILSFVMRGKNTIENMMLGLGISHMGIGLFIISLIFACICLIPVYQLRRFSSLTKRSLQSNNEEQLGQALGKLKQVFQFWGILSVLITVYYGTMLIKVLLIVGVMAGFSFLK